MTPMAPMTPMTSMTADALYEADLAQIHHQHFGSVAQAAADVLLALLRDDGVACGRVAELGAGSGILARQLLAAGYRHWGVDCSAAMLELARGQAPAAELQLASLWDVELPRDNVAVVGVGEVFCYGAAEALPDLQRLETRLAAIHAALVPGGLLLFDLAGPGRSGPRGFREKLWDKDGVWLGMVERERADGSRLTRTITSFIPAQGVGAEPLYRKRVETHQLRLYDPAAVGAALERAGFGYQRGLRYGELDLLEGWHVFAARRG
jgi:SAM-dependent methyltransferase